MACSNLLVLMFLRTAAVGIAGAFIGPLPPPVTPAIGTLLVPILKMADFSLPGRA